MIFVNVTAGFCLADGQCTGSVEHLAERAVHQLISITESAGFCRANIQREPYMTFVSINISAGFCRADSQRELYMTLVFISVSAGFCRADSPLELYMTLVFISVSAGFCRADSQRTGPVECADGDRLWPHDLVARAYLSDALCRHYRLRVHARRREGAGLLLFLLHEVSAPHPTPARPRPPSIPTESVLLRSFTCYYLLFPFFLHFF